MQDINLKLQELFNNKPSGVNSIFWGYKTIGNELTNQQCFVFSVKNKKSKYELLEQDIIPEYIEVNYKQYATDVIEINNISPLLCYLFNSPVDPIVQQHRSKVRPLKGGISITNTIYCGYANIGSGSNILKPYKHGTLGAIVVDNLTNTLVGLTAGHIVSKDISFGHTRNFNTVNPYNIYDTQPLLVYNTDANNNLLLTNIKTTEKYLQSIVQYNESDGFVNINSNDIIGEPKRYIPVYSGVDTSGNFADAGIFTLKPGSINIPESNQQLNLTNTSGLLFATSGEIYQVFNEQKNVYSAGRTTGPKGNIPCELVIGGLGSVIVNGYEINGMPNQSLRFEDALILRYKNNSSYPAADGDSGSVIYADFSGVKKIIGLIFAGNVVNSTSIAYACRIDKIASGLNISPWTGDIRNFDNKAYKKTLLENRAQTGIFINKFGDTYSQGGIISSFKLPKDEFVGDRPLQTDDMVVSYLNSFQGLNSYEAVFDLNVETVLDGFPVPNAAVTYQIQVTNQSEICCSDTGTCFDPNKTVLRSFTNKTSTASDGSLRVSMRNTSEDGLCFLFKILNVEKPNYNFRPEASVALEKLQIASTEIISDSSNNESIFDGSSPTNPGPIGGGDEIPGNIGNNGFGGGFGGSSMTGGDESKLTQELDEVKEDADNNIVTTGGSGGGGGVSSEGGGVRGGYVGCCEFPASIKKFDDTKFNITVYCVQVRKTMRVSVSIEASVDIGELECKETNFQTRVSFLSSQYSLGWIQIGRGNRIGKDFFIPLGDFKKMTEAPSTPLTISIFGKYNERNCYRDNLKNQRYSKVFKYRVKWDNQFGGENDVPGPHCYGTYLPEGASTLCPAPCCDCCETLLKDARLSYTEQCTPSLTPFPKCAPDQNLQQNEPIWVGCQSICDTKSRTLNTQAQQRREMCEKGAQTCWPCRPKTCEECSVGVASLELLNISPLGLINFSSSQTPLDEQFKTNILHELSL